MVGLSLSVRPCFDGVGGRHLRAGFAPPSFNECRRIRLVYEVEASNDRILAEERIR
jgi:hypothetical protein